jgi:hypothetical protein
MYYRYEARAREQAKQLKEAAVDAELRAGSVRTERVARTRIDRCGDRRSVRTG